VTIHAGIANYPIKSAERLGRQVREGVQREEAAQGQP
jgi:hypothetical protein